MKRQKRSRFSLTEISYRAAMKRELFLHSCRLLVLLLLLNLLLTVRSIADQPIVMTDFQNVTGTWRGTLTGPRGTGPYELTINDDGSWAAVGFGLTFKGSATLVNGKVRFFSENTNRAGTWSLTDQDGQKRLLVLSDDQRSWGELQPAK
jgi:hypothetical protein